MSNQDYNQDLNALESALSLLAQRLDVPTNGNHQEIETLQTEIARLEENQLQAQTALNEATSLIRQMLSTENS